MIQGMPNCTYDDAVDLVRIYCNDVLEKYGWNDVEIIGIKLHGSRLRGQAKPDSDLDAVVEYSGNVKEYAMFNALNDEDYGRCYIDGILVDINPIRREETGTMSDYMMESDSYDKEMLRN